MRNGYANPPPCVRVREMSTAVKIRIHRTRLRSRPAASLIRVSLLLFGLQYPACDLSAAAAVSDDKAGLRDEYYAGGRNGTVFNATSRAFEQPAPAVEDQAAFLRGEAIFEGNFVSTPDVPFGGLGPVYIKTSCISCHPGYGRGRRANSFKTDYGNGYVALVHHPDGRIVKGFTAMLQTRAVHPWVPPVDNVLIHWRPFVDKYGNRYPDGTPYNAGKRTEGTLSYPEAELVNCRLPLPPDYKVSLEATIGIYGTGLLDAIRDEDIIAEYERQQAMPGPIKGRHGPWIYEEHEGRKRLGKFTWHNLRATLQNGPGLNGLYSIGNIAREDRPNPYWTPEWVALQKQLGIDTAELEKPQKPELSQKDLADFMVWHRGLAVPAARNLDDPQVKRGKKLFYAANCVQCHKPAWTTGEYAYLPGYSHQKIWPWTDLLMHDMGDENIGRYRVYRTPPLWGRGLMKITANHTDMFHDLRARDFEEAILWHFGEGEPSRDYFRSLSREEREALIAFVKAL